jgi:hypothetical protein
MPCPEGVDIPACFEMYNNLYMFDEGDKLKMMYAVQLGGILRGADPSFASQCVQCGQCLDACPQHIQIPDLLENVADEFEGLDLEERLAAAKQLFADDNC